MMKRFQCRVPTTFTKGRMDDYLFDWLPKVTGTPVSKTKIRNLIITGSVYVNRHRSKNPSLIIFSGANIELYFEEDQSKVNREQLESMRITRNNIVYEDEWLLVISKPAGMPTQPTIDPLRTNLFNEVKELSKTYVGLHHRLDKDTSGLVLFTKKESANFGVSELFSKHLIQKSYQCLAWRSPEAPLFEVGQTVQVKNFLGRLNESGDKARFGEVHSGGDQAITDFKVIEVFKSAYWLEAKPKTGRTHQIRVHALGLGLPLLGDPLYFPKGVIPFINAPRLMLHAERLEFEHPMNQKKMNIEAMIPDDFLSVLGRLRA